MLMKMSAVAATIAVLVIAQFTSARPQRDFVNCGGNAADIVFILDTSSSIWKPDFDFRVKPFVRDVVAIFDIGPAPSQSRVGVVTFSNDFYHEFHLNEYMDKDLLSTAIDNIGFSGGDTYTNKAIVHARETMFTAKNGARNDVAHIVIILTDGASSSTDVTLEEAEKAKVVGIQIFAIGVGNKVKFSELRGMASDPDSEFVFRVKDFRALDSIKRQLAIRTCQVTATAPLSSTTTSSVTRSTSDLTTTKPSTTTIAPPATSSTSTPSTTTAPLTTSTSTTSQSTAAPKITRPTRTPSGILPTSDATDIPINDGPGDRNPDAQDCWGKPADVYFLLDASSSIWIKHFNEKVLKFVRDTVQVFDIGPTKTRVGLVTFSNKIKAVFDLDEYTSKDELMKAIRPETVEHLTGGTNTAAAIAYVRKQGFSPKVARPGVAQIMIVITDGRSYEPESTALEAAEAHKTGMYLFAVGVGPSIDMDELKSIASDPDDDFVFQVNSFDVLDTVKDLLVWQTCRVKPTSSETIDPADQGPADIKGCKMNPTDVMFVFESASKTHTNRGIVRDLIIDLATHINATSDQVRVGVLTDPCPAENEIPFTSLDQFRSMISGIIEKKFINVYDLLRKLWQEEFQADEIVGDHRRHTAVVFLDEDTRDLHRVKEEAARAMYQGIQVFVVAIGNVDEKTVEEVSSSPAKAHVIRVKDYSGLKNLKMDMLQRLCTVSPDNHLQFLPPVKVE